MESPPNATAVFSRRGWRSRRRPPLVRDDLAGLARLESPGAPSAFNSQAPPVVLERVLVDGRRRRSLRLVQSFPPGSRLTRASSTRACSFLPALRGCVSSTASRGLTPAGLTRARAPERLYTSSAGPLRVPGARRTGRGLVTGRRIAALLAFELRSTSRASSPSALPCSVLALALAACSLRVRGFEAAEAPLEAAIQEAVANVKVLSGLLPICASCKKIRDDSGYWNQIETYIREHSDAEFSPRHLPRVHEQALPRLRGGPERAQTGSRNS